MKKIISLLILLLPVCGFAQDVPADAPAPLPAQQSPAEIGPARPSPATVPQSGEETAPPSAAEWRLQASSEPALPAPQTAYTALEDALGPDAAQVLVRRNVVLLSGRKNSQAILHVQWPVLEALSTRAKDLALLPELCEKVRAKEALEADPVALRRISQMAEAGPVTAGVRSAAMLLAAHLENTSTLSAPLAASTQKPLPALAWGAPFWERIHGDALTDFQDAASRFFSEFLLGPHRSAEAEAHYLSHMKAVHGSDERPILESDLSAAAASPRTLDSLSEYLQEQRRLFAASLLRERLTEIEKTTSLRRDLQDISELAGRLVSGPDMARALRFALQSPGPQPRARFSGADLHVFATESPGPFDVGDTALVSLAYWIEGLSPNESIEVTEAGFLDAEEAGVQEARVETVKRTGNGPYTATLRVPLRSAGRKNYRFILQAPDGAAMRSSIEIEVSPRVEELRLAAAEAEGLSQLCRLEESEKSLDSLSDRAAPLREKPQGKAFLSWLGSRRRLAAGQAARWKTLQSLLDGVRLHASKEQCDFRCDKARRALELLEGLPSGCDQTGSPSLRADLESLLRATESRRENQDAFRAAAARGRKLESACRHEEAAETYAAALALLDSDGEARCGPWESEYTAIRLRDLPRARAGKAFADEFAALREKAARKIAEKDPAQALAVLNPLLARIDSLPDPACYREERRKSEELALAAGTALPAPAPALALESLPKDAPEEAAAAVAAERARINRMEAERRERESKRQEPTVRTDDAPTNEALPKHAVEPVELQ